MLKPSPEEVLISINQGIRNAEKSYETASGVPLWDGPEYLMTAYIFQSILKLAKRNCLTLELKPKIVEKYTPKRKGRPFNKPKSESARTEGRCDIILWIVDTNITRAIIEVKRYAEQCPEDIDRVIYLLTKGLEFGVLASLLYSEVKNGNTDLAKKKILKKLDRLSDEIKKEVNSKGKFDTELVRGNIKPRELDGDKLGEKKTWLWCPVCFKIYCKNE